VCKQLRCDGPLDGRVWTGMTKQSANEPHTLKRLISGNFHQSGWQKKKGVQSGWKEKKRLHGTHAATLQRTAG